MKRILVACIGIFSLSSGICKDIIWSFPPTTLSSPSINATDPHVATDSSGNLVGVWLENNSVVAKSKPLNMSWGSGTTLSTAAASNPLVVSDSAGNATAIWLQSGIVMAASKPFNSSWSSAIALSASGASTPALAVGPSGVVIAGWAKSANNIQTSTKIFGLGWNTVKTISSNNATNPRIAIGGGTTGTTEAAVIAWNMTSSSVPAIAAATRVIQNNWTGERVISDLNHNAGYPDVAVDSNGNMTAAWYLYDVNGSNYTNVTVQSATNMFALGTWTAPVVLSAPGIRNPANLAIRVAYDKSGNAIALWNTSYDNETFSIEAAIKPVQNPWGSPASIVSSNLYALGAGLGVTALDDALSLYMFYNGNTMVIQSAETDTSGFQGNNWSVPIVVSSGLTNGFPKIAATLFGNSVYAGTLWTSYNGSNTQVMASTGVKSLPLPPSSLAVTQSVTNYGIYQNYYNTLTWSASSDPNVVGYLIYRNGLFLESVSFNVLQYVDNNRVQNGTDVYGVASINNQNDHSPIITVNFP